MISIVTAYFNRKKLFLRTLQRVQEQIDLFKLDVEFIVVDDGSSEDERLEDLTQEFQFLKIIRLEPVNKWYRNSCVPFNCAFEHVQGEMVIIQNPECYHFGDILKYTKENLQKNHYLSFGCFSLDKESTDNNALFYNKSYIQERINHHKHVVEVDGAMGWYNHSLYRARAYHFCTAIHIEDLIELGGFDERYARGIGFDDDEFIFRIKLKKMKIDFVDNVVVLHQNHYTETKDTQKTAKYSQSFHFERNKQLYQFVTLKSNSFFVGALNMEKNVTLPSFHTNKSNTMMKFLIKLKETIGITRVNL